MELLNNRKHIKERENRLQLRTVFFNSFNLTGEKEK